MRSYQDTRNPYGGHHWSSSRENFFCFWMSECDHVLGFSTNWCSSVLMNINLWKTLKHDHIQTFKNRKSFLLKMTSDGHHMDFECLDTTSSSRRVPDWRNQPGGHYYNMLIDLKRQTNANVGCSQMCILPDCCWLDSNDDNDYDDWYFWH